MKRLLAILALVGVLVGGYYWVRRNTQLSLSFLEGKKTTVRRGDLVVPITANGHIKPASVTRIKAEASGEIVEIPFDVGMMVRRGDLLIRLDEDDEQRNVDRATADFARAEVNLEQTRIAERQHREVGVRLAEAKVAQAEARSRRADFEYERVRRLREEGQAGPAEFEYAESAKREADALLVSARAEVQQAQLAIEAAVQDGRVAEENVKNARKALEDAQERLRETRIYSPIDGMVLERPVQVGEVVLSGTKSLTGGNVLVELADVSAVYAVVNVDEADIGLVRQLAPPSAVPGPTATQAVFAPGAPIDPDQQVEVEVESFPQSRFHGVIERIAPQSELNQAIATFKVWIRITSENRHELVGLLNTQAEAHFTARSVTNALLVSYDAFRKNPNGEGFGVYVPVNRPGQTREGWEFRPCRFGADNGIDVEVLEGLAEGEEVFTVLPVKTEKERRAEDRAAEEE